MSTSYKKDKGFVMSTLKNTVASLFIMAGMAGAPDAEAKEPTKEPITECNPSEVFERFRTATGFQDFGNDGCVYNVTGGRSFAVKNYNMNSERGALQFTRDIDRAAKVEGRISANEERRALADIQRAERDTARAARNAQNEARRARAQNRRCENGIVSILGGVLDGKKPKDSTILKNAHKCTY